MAVVHVLGAGISGLWQAVVLRSRGHRVTVWDPAGSPSACAASRLAGAMLAPFCEGEAGHEIVRDLGIESLCIWRKHYEGVVANGTLVVAMPRDDQELSRFARMTTDHRTLREEQIANLEPALADRFHRALYYEGEAHVDPAATIASLARGIDIRTAARDQSIATDWIIDCRGISATDTLRTLRGVRGERILLQCPDVSLRRPIRLLHPRIPFYIVPWGGGIFMIGATVIESEDGGFPTARSVFELLAAVYALNPAFGEARILDISAGVRPAFPDNIPKIVIRGQTLFVNGLYRHGFLLSPILARLTADYIEAGSLQEGITVEDHGQW